jgi:hypothetical protein
MKTKILPSILLAFACLGGIAASTPEKKNVPETSKVLFENDRTRVIEYHTNSGRNICGMGMHSHPAHVYIMLTDAKLRIVTPDGKEELVDSKAGEVGWEPAVTHIAENLTGKDAACYLIEFKDKDWKPSTGMPK